MPRSDGSPANLSANLFLAILLSNRDHPVVIAHRGDSFRAPENTLEAARLGWEAGASAWGARRSAHPRRGADCAPR